MVRAPLARLIGLINLIENGDASDFELPELLEHIKNSGLELDAIIRKIVKQTDLMAKDLSPHEKNN